MRSRKVGPIKWISGGLLSVVIAVSALAPAGAALAAAGPIEWCPAPNGHDAAACVVASSIQDGVNKALAAKVPGTVYINAGTYTENITATKLSGVTINGNADSGGGTLINGSITISKSKNVSILFLFVTSGITVTQATGAGLFAGNTAALNISQSNFSKNPGTGLEITTHLGSVNLNKITAGKNQVHGIRIVGGTSVTMTDISASGNTADGLYVSSPGAITIGTVKSALNHFDKNKNYGVELVTTAPALVSLADISAVSNTLVGLTVSGNGDRTITAVRSKLNKFDSNGSHGIEITTTDDVTLSDVSASRNLGNGVLLTSPASLTIQAVRGKINHFDKNGGYGLSSTGTALSASLTDLTASSNASDGVYLLVSGTTTITTSLSKLNHFDKNLGNGVMISSLQTLVLNDVSAVNNGVDGFHVASLAGISIGLVHAQRNLFDSNGSYGLEMVAGLPSTISTFSASKNHAPGVFITTSATGTSITLTCGIATGNATFDIVNNMMLSAGTLHLNGMVLTHDPSISVSNTGGTVVSSPGCS